MKLRMCLDVFLVHIVPIYTPGARPSVVNVTYGDSLWSQHMITTVFVFSPALPRFSVVSDMPGTNSCYKDEFS